MAKVIRSGAEHPIGVGEVFSQNISRLTLSTNGKRSGNYSFAFNPDNGIGGNTSYGSINIDPLSEIYYGSSFYTTVHYVTSPFIQFRVNTTTLIGIGLNGTHFTVLVNGSVVATGTFNYLLNNLYQIEVHIVIADSGSIELKVDGLQDITYSGDTLVGANTTINNVYFYGLKDDGTGFFYIDDIAINDTTGGVDDSWCGTGRIIYLPANASGDVTQLTPNTGTNYAAVDELAQDGDTTYVEGDAVDEHDLYNVAASGLAAGSTILRVTPVSIAKDTIANGGKVAVGLKTVDTEYFGSDVILITSYGKVDGTEYLVNPNTGAAWTIAQLDALQVGIKSRGT